jgi:uncharacterized alpha/beta hydrolase family protein
VKTIYVVILILLSFVGCAYLKVGGELQQLGNLVTIEGTVKQESSAKSPIMIVLIKDEKGFLEVEDYIYKKSTGDFSFVVEAGKYTIYSWTDRNKNQKFDDNEEISMTQLDIQEAGTTIDVNITISDKLQSTSLNNINYLKDTLLHDIIFVHNHLGEIKSLDDVIFTQANAKRGFWQTYTSFKEIPYGIYFLKEYDPKKKVVLFVHGINGTPQNFKYLIENLDDSSQAMVFYYPSGLQLEHISQYLYRLLEELELKYKFENIAIVAHSIGGLVAREYINLQTKKKNHLVNQFISISTPWNGHKGAKITVDYALRVIPVVRDIAPNSSFQQSMFQTKLPASIKHYLLFGYKGSNMMMRNNNDGVVSIDSQLSQSAQESAHMIRGFNETHTSILDSKEVSKFVNSILKANLEGLY